MQTVDEMLARLINTLQQTGQLDNTYIIFTSDNGYHLGQHRLMGGKGTAYEEDIVVVTHTRAERSAGAALNGYVSGNIDIAPTIAELAAWCRLLMWMAARLSRCSALSVLLNPIGVRLSHRVLWRGRSRKCNSSLASYNSSINCSSRWT